MVYRSTVGGISVNCRSNISGMLIYQVSPTAFLSKDVINYCYHAMGEYVAVRGRLLYEANRRALGTKEMVTVFFPVCVITDRLSFSC